MLCFDGVILCAVRTRRDRVYSVTVAYYVMTCQDRFACHGLQSIEDNIHSIDISDYHTVPDNVIMAYLMSERMSPFSFKENAMPKDKATYSIELEKDMMWFLEQMTTEYSLPDVSKTMRCLVNYARYVETARDDIFAEIRCNTCD